MRGEPIRVHGFRYSVYARYIRKNQERVSHMRYFKIVETVYAVAMERIFDVLIPPASSLCVESRNL
jgi:hypothetical protein